MVGEDSDDNGRDNNSNTYFIINLFYRNDIPTRQYNILNKNRGKARD